MDRFNEPSWSSYFFTGTLAVVLSWALSGCVFGNHVYEQGGKSTFAKLYFETENVLVTYCAILEGSDEAVCGDLDANRAPTWTQDLVSDPIGLQVKSGSSDAALFNAFDEEPLGLGVGFDLETGALSQETTYDPDLFWFSDGSCLSSFLLSATGQASSYEEPLEISGIEVSGRLEVDLVGMIQYDGAGCGQAFAQIRDCYLDAEQCGESTPEANAELHEGLVEMFDAYIDAGAVTSTDLDKIVALGYQVSYR